MGIKGKTVFELTDVNTGKVERYEDTNMVTNALQYYLETYGMFTNNILANDDIRQKRLWKNLVGGLFLFDKNIEENVENTFMPAGVSMIGNGSFFVITSSSGLLKSSARVQPLASYLIWRAISRAVNL